MVNNQSLQNNGYNLRSIGRDAPTSVNEPIVKGIDGLYENLDPNSNIKYVIDEAKFGSSKLGYTQDKLQMSNCWLTGHKTGNDRILAAVNGDKSLADKIVDALNNNQVERVLSKVDKNGVVTTFRLDSNGNVIGTWP